jgi:hypothetical protein
VNNLELSFEQQVMLSDLVQMKILSLRRDVDRAVACGTLDYSEILIDELNKYHALLSSLNLCSYATPIHTD